MPVPEADRVVGEWRDKYDWAASAGVPAHITLLGPFLPSEQIGPEVRGRLDSLFGSWRPMAFRLAAVQRLSTLVYLAPEPVAPFRGLTEMLEREWPEVPPYGSAFDEPIYHLTVARDPSAFRRIARKLQIHLPIEAVARQALLLAREGGSDVRLIARFPFRS